MLHLIRHGKAAGDSQAGTVFARTQCFAENDPIFPSAPRLKTFFRRSLFGGLLLGLLGFIPAPIVLSSLTPALEAQAYRGRIRGGASPAAMPRQTEQGTSTATPQTGPSAATPTTSASAPSPATPSATAAAANSTPGLPPSLLDQPPQPAKIEFSAKSLSIHADNASLGAILREVASKTGMQLQGFSRDERVFGSFGPGTPREVLDDLLNGTPYDLVMVGDLSNGAPRQLILSPSTPGGPTPPSPQEIAAQNEEYAPPPPPVRPPQAGREMPPGMNPQRVRTPQQMLQELQQMRERQQQGQQR